MATILWTGKPGVLQSVRSQSGHDLVTKQTVIPTRPPTPSLSSPSCWPGGPWRDWAWLISSPLLTHPRFPLAITCKKPARSSMENTSITSIAPALALLTTGVSGQLQGSPCHHMKPGKLRPGGVPSPRPHGLGGKNPGVGEAWLRDHPRVKVLRNSAVPPDGDARGIRGVRACFSGW